MKFDGIIFDLDGTLVNSEPLHMKAWLDVLARQDLHFDEHWFDQWIGKPDWLLADAVILEHQLPLNTETLVGYKRSDYHRMAAAGARLFPKVEEGLSALQNKYKLGIATSSSKNDAAAVFSRTKLDRYFQTVVTSDQVQRMKPAPDCYLLAAERIGLNPANGLAVEDSVAGIRAAKEAGLYTLAVANSHSAEKLKEAHLVFEDTAAAMIWILEGGDRA